MTDDPRITRLENSVDQLRELSAEHSAKLLLLAEQQASSTDAIKDLAVSVNRHASQLANYNMVQKIGQWVWNTFLSIVTLIAVVKSGMLK